MKHLARLLSLLILVSAGIFFANCDGGGDPKKSEEETQLGKLKFVWTLQSAELDSSPDDRFDAGTVTLNLNGTYAAGAKYNFSFTSTSQVQGSPWPSGDKWKFGSTVSNTMIRLDSELDGSDDVSMGYVLSSDGKELTISFTYPDTSPGYVIGKTKSASGAWEFVFTRP